jgi:iron-sulfur cluster assembly accessory protein
VVTAAAARRLGEVKKTLAAKPGVERLALRVRVDSGGCSGFKYTFDLDLNGPQSDDAVFERDGATVLVDRASLPMVDGATLNWSEEMMRQAFSIINNPNSDAGCSCGASFTPK